MRVKRGVSNKEFWIGLESNGPGFSVDHAGCGCGRGRIAITAHRNAQDMKWL